MEEREETRFIWHPGAQIFLQIWNVSIKILKNYNFRKGTITDVIYL